MLLPAVDPIKAMGEENDQIPGDWATPSKTPFPKSVFDMLSKEPICDGRKKDKLPPKNGGNKENEDDNRHAKQQEQQKKKVDLINDAYDRYSFVTTAFSKDYNTYHDDIVRSDIYFDALNDTPLNEKPVHKQQLKTSKDVNGNSIGKIDVNHPKYDNIDLWCLQRSQYLLVTLKFLPRHTIYPTEWRETAFVTEKKNFRYPYRFKELVLEELVNRLSPDLYVLTQNYMHSSMLDCKLCDGFSVVSLLDSQDRLVASPLAVPYRLSSMAINWFEFGYELSISDCWGPNDCHHPLATPEDVAKEAYENKDTSKDQANNTSTVESTVPENTQTTTTKCTCLGCIQVQCILSIDDEKKKEEEREGGHYVWWKTFADKVDKNRNANPIWHSRKKKMQSSISLKDSTIDTKTEEENQTDVDESQNAPPCLYQQCIYEMLCTSWHLRYDFILRYAENLCYTSMRFPPNLLDIDSEKSSKTRSPFLWDIPYFPPTASENCLRNTFEKYYELDLSNGSTEKIKHGFDDNSSVLVQSTSFTLPNVEECSSNKSESNIKPSLEKTTGSPLTRQVGKQGPRGDRDWLLAAKNEFKKQQLAKAEAKDGVKREEDEEIKRVREIQERWVKEDSWELNRIRKLQDTQPCIPFTRLWLNVVFRDKVRVPERFPVRKVIEMSELVPGCLTAYMDQDLPDIFLFLDRPIGTIHQQWKKQPDIPKPIVSHDYNYLSDGIGVFVERADITTIRYPASVKEGTTTKSCTDITFTPTIDLHDDQQDNCSVAIELDSVCIKIIRYMLDASTEKKLYHVSYRYEIHKPLKSSLTCSNVNSEIIRAAATTTNGNTETTTSSDSSTAEDNGSASSTSSSSIYETSNYREISIGSDNVANVMVASEENNANQESWSNDFYGYKAGYCTVSKEYLSNEQQREEEEVLEEEEEENEDLTTSGKDDSKTHHHKGSEPMEIYSEKHNEKKKKKITKNVQDNSNSQQWKKDVEDGQSKVPCIIKLYVAKDAKVAFSRADTKLRVNKATVVGIFPFKYDVTEYKTEEELKKADKFDPRWTNLRYMTPVLNANGWYFEKFEYVVGEEVSAPNFDGDMNKVCVPGIHLHFIQSDALEWHGIVGAIPDHIRGYDIVEACILEDQKSESQDIKQTEMEEGQQQETHVTTEVNLDPLGFDSAFSNLTMEN